MDYKKLDGDASSKQNMRQQQMIVEKPEKQSKQLQKHSTIEKTNLSGQSNKRNKLKVDLLKARSVSNKTYIINDLCTDNHLDILVLSSKPMQHSTNEHEKGKDFVNS